MSKPLTWCIYRQCRRLSMLGAYVKVPNHESRLSMSTKSLVNDRKYCENLVRTHDYENYLVTLLLSGATRRAAFAIRAFNVELALVHDTVSDKERGLMRMQFWKDTLENIFKGSIPNTPVAIELAGAVHHFKLTKKWFQRILEGRVRNLSEQGYRTVTDLETYAESTVSSLTYLLLESLYIKNIHADHAASHIGKAQAIVTILRATPYHASKSKIYLPLELFAKHNISQEAILRGKDRQSFNDLVFDLASTAHKHLATARSLKNDVPQDASIVFLNTIICQWYLDLLQQCNFDVFDRKMQRRNSWLPLQLWMQKLRRTY